MATYSTDLTTLTTAESGTWTEFNSPYNGAGTPAADGENFIQGTDCRSQTTGKAVGLEISCVFDNGSNVTITSGDAVFAWVFYAVGVNLETYANGGLRYGIGSGTGAWEWWTIGGSDYGRNPYGGWVNVAVDPEATSTAIGGGNSGNYRYFGSVPYTLNEITKGTPSAQDAIRHGRGEISVTGSGGSFAELAQYNDYNAGGTPPGTSSTSVDSGRHRLGLFQEQSGTYLWKGLMSMGLSGTSVTFSDSNETIIIDDAPNTYAAFNKIEINNASSSVTWTGITFISTGTTAPGNFEVINDTATVNLTTCSFNAMGTFVLGSGTTADRCSWNGCGQITANEADLAGSSFLASTVAADGAAVSWDQTISGAATISKLDDTTFSMGANNHHAVSFSANVSNGANLTLRNIEFTGFDADGVGDSDNSIIELLATTGTITLTLEGCTVDGSAATESNFTVDTRAGCSVDIVTGAVTAKVTATNDSGVPIQSARVHVRASAGPLPYGDAVTITRATTTATVAHTGHGLETNDKIFLRGITDKTTDNGVKQITVTGVNAYTFTTTDSGSTSYTGDGFIIDGQDETSYTASFSGGTGHAASDVIRLRGGTRVTVDAVSGGVVTQFTVDSGNSVGGRSASDVQDQIGTTGSGTGFSLTLAAGNIVTQIRCTYVALDGDTDVNGEISISRVFGSNQPVTGWARKAASSPYYKEGSISGQTINSSTGLDFTTVMVSDE